jgi:hypothetical protein
MTRQNAARTLSVSGKQPDRRKAARRRVKTDAVLETMKGDRIEGVIADLSMLGCAVKGPIDDLGISRFVSFAIKGEPPLQGIVRWVRDGSAGIEFLQPVPSELAGYHKLINRTYAA